jgi:uncharacterized protein YjbJ (UPF0337 family)
MKGTIKEEVGTITNDRDLKAEGKAEKKEGKVHTRKAMLKKPSRFERQANRVENRIGHSVTDQQSGKAIGRQATQHRTRRREQ